MKITIQQLDKLIESELTNMKNVGNTDDIDLTSIVNNDIGVPVNDYLTRQEKAEQDKLTYYNKLKTINTNPDRRRATDNDIKDTKSRMDRIRKLQTLLKNKQSELERMQQMQKMKSQTKQNKPDNTQTVIRQQISTGIQEMFDGMPDPDRYAALPMLKRQSPFKEELKEMTPEIQPNTYPAGVNPAMPVQPKKKKLKVTFNSKTANPFQAEFTERGFLIGSTRLSFEVIETALSKNFTITLDNGSGLVLDAINMQKLLKYKDKV